MASPGQRIGNLRLEHELGHGGMGAVYLAWDERLARRVAVKAVRRERLGGEARARFLREARILSQLDHPGICRVHEFIDGEVTDYLVLELVEGRRLRDLVDAGGLDREARLRIAAQLADALAAAHARGIVHRDLKPENVMVTASGDVKVLDFGLAHAPEETEEESDDTTRAMQEPSPFAGGEPEPVEGDPTLHSWRISDDAGGTPSTAVRTALGSVVGTPRYMSPEQARGEVVGPASDCYSLGLLLQEIFTGASPYPPDLPFPVVMQRAARGETQPVAGIDRDVAALIEQLHALAPAERPTARETHARLLWIRDRPRRRTRRALFAAVAGLAFVGLAGVAVELRAERNAAMAARNEALASRAAAEARRGEAEEVSRFLVDLFENADPGRSRGAAITAREILERGAARVRHELAGQPVAQARLMAAIGEVACHLGLYDEAMPLLGDALAARRRLLGADHLDVAASADGLGRCAYEQADYDEAERLLKDAVAIRERRLGPEHPDLARSLRNLGLVYWREERLDEAEPLYRRSLAILERTTGADSAEVSKVLNNLGELYKREGRPADAGPLLERSLRIKEAQLAPDDPLIASTLNNLGELRYQEKRYDEAEADYRRALAIWEKVLGPEHPQLASVLNNLATLEDDTGRSAEAERVYRRALAILVKKHGPDHPWVGITLNNLADVAQRQGRDAEAAELYRRSIASIEGSVGADHPLVSHPLLGLARLEARAGHAAEAVRLASRAATVRAKALGEDHPDTVEARAALDELRGGAGPQKAAVRH